MTKHKTLNQNTLNMPDYKKIYKDLIRLKYPQLAEKCSLFLKKDKLLACDVIKLSEIIIGRENKEFVLFNKRHQFHDVQSIMRILRYQKENGYNNSEIAREFGLSRNTIAKWKKEIKLN